MTQECFKASVMEAASAILCHTHHAAVHVEPPVTHEVLLVVERAVGAEEAGDGGGAAGVGAAHVVHLAVRLLHTRRVSCCRPAQGRVTWSA